MITCIYSGGRHADEPSQQKLKKEDQTNQISVRSRVVVVVFCANSNKLRRNLQSSTSIIATRQQEHKFICEGDS